jgi:hypothetical protein
MRASLLLLSFLLGACTVVPTPTTSLSAASDPNLVGTWRSVTEYNSDSLVQRLAIFSDGSYERWAVDSSAVGISVVLTEDGTWAFPTTDTAHLVFSPASRDIWPRGGTGLAATATTPDTSSWSRAPDTLYFTLPEWYQRDSSQTLGYTRD